MRPGEVVSVTGRNGAGKTTLLRILGGLVAPDRGDVVLDGIRLGTRRRAYQRQIGLLTPGDRGLYARVTVARHLDLWARLALLERDARAAAISDCYARFELAELADLRVDVLSMGQRQRVRLALAFLHAPRLVLLDEPANSLDLEALAIAARRGRRRRAPRRPLPRGRAGGRAHGNRRRARAGPARRPPGAGMTRLAPHAAAAAGIFRRDMTVYLSYRWRLGAQYVGVLFSLAVFFYISRLVRVPAFPTPQAYFAFAAVGVIILQVLQATLDIPVAVRQELVAGTFERMAVSPFGPVASILSLFLFPIVSAVLTMLVTLALTALVFGVDASWSRVPLAIPVAVVGALALGAIALLFVAMIVRFKQAPGAAYVLAADLARRGLLLPGRAAALVAAAGPATCSPSRPPSTSCATCWSASSCAPRRGATWRSSSASRLSCSRSASAG